MKWITFAIAVWVAFGLINRVLGFLMKAARGKQTQPPPQSNAPSSQPIPSKAAQELLKRQLLERRAALLREALEKARANEDSTDYDDDADDDATDYDDRADESATDYDDDADEDGTDYDDDASEDATDYDERPMAAAADDLRNIEQNAATTAAILSHIKKLPPPPPPVHALDKRDVRDPALVRDGVILEILLARRTPNPFAKR